MEVPKFAAKIFLVIVGVLLIQFLYFGVTTTPEMLNESDSLAYHIPIAKQLALGSFMPPVVHQGLGFYPGTAEAILSVFILFHLPLNTFGVLGLAIFFYLSIKVGQSFGLNKDLAIVYAGVIVTLQSVLRLPLTQTVDIWQNVFFLIVLLLLRNPKPSTKYFALLGGASGLLIGTKYTGLLYFIVLAGVFVWPALKKINIIRFVVFLIPATILGFSWYIRNFLLTCNPLYPANMFFLVGNPDFIKSDYFSWSLIGLVIKNPLFLLQFLGALVSEYLGWFLVLLLPVWLMRRNFGKDVSKLAVSGALIFIIFATLLVATPVASNLRYLYPAMSTLILATFLALEKKYLEILIAFSVIMTTLSLMNLDYHPKILILAFIPLFYLVFINGRFNLYNHI